MAEDENGNMYIEGMSRYRISDEDHALSLMFEVLFLLILGIHSLILQIPILPNLIYLYIHKHQLHSNVSSIIIEEMSAIVGRNKSCGSVRIIRVEYSIAYRLYDLYRGKKSLFISFGITWNLSSGTPQKWETV